MAHLSVFSRLDDPDSIHPVGASHLKAYLDVMYGGEMPHDERASALAHDYHTALSQLSTDQVFYSQDANPFVQITRYTRLIGSFITATNAVGEHVGLTLTEQLITPQNTSKAANDLVYMLGLHDVASFVIAGQLQLRHPRLDNPQLVERAQAVTAADRRLERNRPEGMPSIFELTLESRIVGEGLKRRIRTLLASGQLAVDRAESYLTVIRQLTEDSPLDESG